MTDVIPGGITLGCSARARCNTALRMVPTYVLTFSDLSLITLSVSLMC